MSVTSNVVLSASERIQDYEYLYASNTNVSSFVSVKLAGSRNYFQWKAQMLCLLESKNMAGIVDAAFVAPRDSSPETVRQYDCLVRGWIFGSVSEDVLVNIFNLNSAKAVWEKLKLIYDPSECLQNASENAIENSATPTEIIVVGDQSPPLEEERKRVNRIKQIKKLHDVTVAGDWSKLKSILKRDECLATEAINSVGSTILHMAVERGHNDIVQKVFSYVNDEEVLTKRTSDGSTPLHIAAIVGNKQAAELLVKKNSQLLRTQDNKGEEPLQKAYENKHIDTIRYLLKALNAQCKSESRSSIARFSHRDVDTAVDLLVNVISAKQFSLASELLQQFPDVASTSDEILMAIAKTFPSGTSFILFERTKKRKERSEAQKVLEMVCDSIDKLDYSGYTHHPYYTRPILEAACQNADQVVHEILIRSPETIQSTDKNGYDIIQLAILHRSEKIYNFIYDIGERKNIYRTLEDSHKNNILHLVGKLALPNVNNQRTKYAALQLQEDLRWREELKKFVLPAYVNKENIFKETPNMIFKREHKNLVIEGERWMKTTTKSSSIIAALITTLVFGAAITVLGGSDLVKGAPLLEKKRAFVVFVISAATSLFASMTALLVFLYIQTLRYDEKDFLSLPRTLLIGLSFLLLSTASIIIAFSAILFLVFRDQKPWVHASIFGFAIMSTALFGILQYPIMVDLFKSTYLPIFRKQGKSVHS